MVLAMRKLLLLFFCLTACGTSGDPDYRRAYGVPPLEVPPELVPPPQSSSYAIPGENPPRRAEIPTRARISRRKDALVLELPMPYDLAWERVGDAIEGIGLTVDDRDRSRGIYYVSHGKGKKGFVSSLAFWQRKRTGKTYLLEVTAESDRLAIARLYDERKNLIPSSEATPIFEKLARVINREL